MRMRYLLLNPIYLFIVFIQVLAVLCLFPVLSSEASAYSFFNYSVQDMHDAWNVYAHQLRYVFYIKCYSEQFFGGSSSIRQWTVPLTSQKVIISEGSNSDGNNATQCVSWKILGIGIDGSSVTNMTFKTSGSYIFQAGMSLSFQYDGEVYNQARTEDWGNDRDIVQTVNLGNKPIILTNTNGFTRPGDVSRWLNAGFPSQFNFKPIAMNFEKTAESPTYHEYTSTGYIIWHHTDTYNLDFAGYGENAYNSSPPFTRNRVSVWAGDIYDHGQSLLDVYSGQGWRVQLAKSPLTFMPVTALQDQVQHQYLQQILTAIQENDNTAVVNAVNQTTSAVTGVNNRINDLRTEEQARHNQAQQAANQRLDVVMNDNTASSEGQLANFMTSFQDDMDTSLSSIITAPIRLAEATVGTRCSPLVLPLPFVDANLSLPCPRELMQTNFPALLYLYDVVSTGLIAYALAVHVLKIANQAKDPNSAGRLEIFDL